MMRVAALSDIHGNAVALEAVLADIAERGEPDEYWLLGDLVALGPDPVGVLELLTSLPEPRIIRGNTERYVYTGRDRPPPDHEACEADPSLLPVLAEVAATFAWTQGVLTGAGWIEWLEALPTEIRATLPDGTRALAVHASPSADDGRGLDVRDPDDALLSRVAGCGADLVLAGHVHRVLDRRVGEHHLVNLGSVSNPVEDDRRASYVWLDCDDAGYRVEHRRVDYDRQAVIDQMHALRHPGARYVVGHLAGEFF